MIDKEYKKEPLEAQALELLYLCQQIADEIRTTGRPINMVVITFGVMGPRTEAYAKLDRPPPSCNFRGIIRCCRIELPQMTALMMDTDRTDRTVVKQMLDEIGSLDDCIEISYRNGKRYTPRLDVSPRMPIRPGFKCPGLDEPCEDGAVIITGGNGGIGVLTAEALYEAGYKRLVLASRSGNITALGVEQGLQDRVDELMEKGATVIMEKCDTGDEKAVIGMCKRVREKYTIKSVIHAAGVLDDRILDMHDAGSMRKSFGPKADGGWYLHTHTRQDPLDSFVVFSSVSSLMGNVGQCNYACSNTYMEELCNWRRSQGLPGTSIGWPAVLGVGMAAAMDEKVRPDEIYAVDTDCVKQVMKQLCCGKSADPYAQYVLPIGNLQAEGSMMALLKAYGDKEAQLMAQIEAMNAPQQPKEMSERMKRDIAMQERNMKMMNK
eukprot:gnl/TRDRNA2_/TRDRNA2_176902_c0_seq1.p1 gnl/TRDRNA2_/TRDRNA2_176902_c0~~gnl/TRDRNA2_/TRDRNA2_176902_c0_seq1.p1  ORF type:complete len:508 (-),score=119.71 gnl/TRDRNA2_/TRDRNA2_176902_c0_seq1:113-1420(-)